MKLSIYFYLFNAELRQFDLDGCIDNFCKFADEVVCATIPSEDDTLANLKKQEKARGKDKFRVVESSISLTDNRFDGKLKTVALQNCSKGNDRLYSIADADELFPLSNKPQWEKWAELLFRSPLDGLLIPVIDLFGDKDSICADQDIGQKFRLHRNTIVARGVIPQAEMPGGFLNVSMSDTTEPLNQFGELGNFASVVNEFDLMPVVSFSLAKAPYVIHTGSLSLDRRAKINKDFWQERWQDRSDRPITNIVTDTKYFEGIKTKKHGLPLE